MAPKLKTGEAHPSKPDARTAGPAICWLPTDADASGRFRYGSTTIASAASQPRSDTTGIEKTNEYATEDATTPQPENHATDGVDTHVDYSWRSLAACATPARRTSCPLPG